MAMIDYDIVLVFILLDYVFIAICKNDFESRVQEAKIEIKCMIVAEEPNFNSALIVGKPWRIYYAWEFGDGQCVDMKFEPASPKNVKKIFYDVYKHLNEKPAWDQLSLLMSIATREMLLFEDSGVSGKFWGLPGIMDPSISNSFNQGVPLLKIQMKLINDKFLLYMDCLVGFSLLAARDEGKPLREEIYSVANTFFPLLGEGRPTCLLNKQT